MLFNKDAIKRERARRNMTDEDRERIRLEKLEKARQQLEKQVFLFLIILYI